MKEYLSFMLHRKSALSGCPFKVKSSAFRSKVGCNYPCLNRAFSRECYTIYDSIRFTHLYLLWCWFSMGMNCFYSLLTYRNNYFNCQHLGVYSANTYMRCYLRAGAIYPDLPNVLNSMTAHYQSHTSSYTRYYNQPPHSGKGRCVHSSPQVDTTNV